MAQQQNWAESHVRAARDDALFQYGEWTMFVLMWNAEDLRQGLVERCQECFDGNRMAAAYGQAPNQECPRCYGTTFDGGFRARVIRPAILSDPNPEELDAKRGEVVTDNLSIQTTADFYSRSGDFMFRANGNRYQMQQMDTVDIRSGFEPVSVSDNVGGVIPGARLEDRTSMAHRIDPSDRAVLAQMLADASQDWHFARNVGRQDLIAPGGGYLVPDNT